MVRTPVATIRHTAANLVDYLRPFPQDYVRVYLGEERPRRVVFWTDTMNLGYVLSLGLGLLGVVGTIRDRRTWPLLCWLAFNTVVLTVLFFPSFMPGRFRLGSMPVVMLFAGVALERLLFGRRRPNASVQQ